MCSGSTNMMSGYQDQNGKEVNYDDTSYIPPFISINTENDESLDMDNEVFIELGGF